MMAEQQKQQFETTGKLVTSDKDFKEEFYYSSQSIEEVTKDDSLDQWILDPDFRYNYEYYRNG